LTAKGGCHKITMVTKARRELCAGREGGHNQMEEEKRGKTQRLRNMEKKGKVL